MNPRDGKMLILVAVAAMALATGAHAQTESVASGDWNTGSTWSTGAVPTSADDVTIAAEHIVTLGGSGSCRNLTFAATSGKMNLTSASAVLNVHGDWTFASSSHLAWDGWTVGARVRFTGTAPVQKLVNLATSSSGTGTTRFDELVVDKAEGKVTTGDETGVGDDRRLRIGRYLDIQSGTFELARVDDLEGRDTSGSATTPDILVRAGATFEMVGGTSHIRRGTFTGADSGKIGTLQVWGSALLSSGSSLRTNFTAVVIEDGGVVQYPTGRNTVSNSFNPGVLTIRSGGAFENSLTTAYWYTNTTTPTTVQVEDGGEFRTSSSTTALPEVLTIDGDLRFSKTLGGDVSVLGRLLLYGQASLDLGGNTLTYGPEAVLQYGDVGQTTMQVTSDAEFPASGGPQDVVVFNESGVTLHADRTIGGSLTVLEGNMLTGGFAITLGSGATLSENASATVLGLVQTTRTVGTGGVSDFGGLGLELAAGSVAPGQTTVVRRTGAALADFGIPRHYDIAAQQSTGLDATLTVGYGDWELDGILESGLALFRSTDDGVNWDEQGGVVDPVGKTVTLAGVEALSLWALAEGTASSVETAPSALSLRQNYPNPFNPSTTIAFDLPAAGEVTLTVHDLRGRHVRALVGGALPAGRHEVRWDGRDAQGNPAASGIYMVNLATPDGSQRSMKITLSK